MAIDFHQDLRETRTLVQRAIDRLHGILARPVVPEHADVRAIRDALAEQHRLIGRVIAPEE